MATQRFFSSTAIQKAMSSATTDVATFANGCFWGTEHLYRKYFGGKGLLDTSVATSRIRPTEKFAPAKQAMLRLLSSRSTRYAQNSFSNNFYSPKYRTQNSLSFSTVRTIPRNGRVRVPTLDRSTAVRFSLIQPNKKLQHAW